MTCGTRTIAQAPVEAYRADNSLARASPEVRKVGSRISSVPRHVVADDRLEMSITRFDRRERKWYASIDECDRRIPGQFELSGEITVLFGPAAAGCATACRRSKSFQLHPDGLLAFAKTN